MLKKILGLLLFLLSFYVVATPDLSHQKWGDLDVIYLEDSSLPVYHLKIYFSDGALSDGKAERGLSKAALSSITMGTRRYTQKEISENLEYYGASLGVSVNHEYSTVSVSGLAKDIVPTIKKVCHLLRDANYPHKVLAQEKRRMKNSIKNSVTNHGALASRAFREISLAGTPYAYPAGGKLKDIKSWNQKGLKRKLQYFMNNVSKRLYLTGPKGILKIRNTILNDCHFSIPKNEKWVTRKVSKVIARTRRGPFITLVTVPKANQAQVRIGQFLTKEQIQRPELLRLSSSFLGGGFTSKLMREVRVKRGLTYSIGAVAAAQNEYGRSFISTFTKNETIIELLSVVKKTISDVAEKKYTELEFNNAKGHLSGAYPFSIETSAAYINQLLFHDHVGIPYAKFYAFPKLIDSLSSSEVASKVGEIFKWEKMDIVVLGPLSLLKKLKTFGKVKVVSYKKFL